MFDSQSIPPPEEQSPSYQSLMRAHLTRLADASRLNFSPKQAQVIDRETVLYFSDKVARGVKTLKPHLSEAEAMALAGIFSKEEFLVFCSVRDVKSKIADGEVVFDPVTLVYALAAEAELEAKGL